MCGLNDDWLPCLARLRPQTRIRRETGGCNWRTGACEPKWAGLVRRSERGEGARCKREKRLSVGAHARSCWLHYGLCKALCYIYDEDQIFSRKDLHSPKFGAREPKETWPKVSYGCSNVACAAQLVRAASLSYLCVG